MHFAVTSWKAVAPGCADGAAWQAWAQAPVPFVQASLPRLGILPMMAARRLSEGCRAAVECSLALAGRDPQIDAAVFTSRHAELARSEKILLALGAGQGASPTDFTMSVHNTAAGVFSIESHYQGSVTSIAAGALSWKSGMLEAAAMLATGASRVLVTDFETVSPAILGARLGGGRAAFSYAAAFILERGDAFDTASLPAGTAGVPASLAFFATLPGDA